MTRTLPLIAALVVVPCVQARAAMEHANSNDHSQRVIAGRGLTGGQDVAIDRIGRVHVVSGQENASGGAVLEYYRQTSPREQFVLFESIGGSSSETVRSHPAIAVAADGTVHLAYVADNGTGAPELYHAERVPDGSFQLEFVDQVADFRTSLDLVLDPQGEPVIAYSGAVDTELRVAFRSGGGWSDEAADSSAGSGTEIDLIHTGNGFGELLAIAHHDFSSSEESLKVTTQIRFQPGSSGLTWGTTTVDGDGSDTGENAAISRLPNGDLVVSYAGNGGFERRVAMRSNATWSSRILDGGSDEDFGNPRFDETGAAMHADVSGQPVLIYGVGQFVVKDGFPLGGVAGREVRMARRWEDGSWSTRTMADNFEGNLGMSLAADLNGAGTPGAVLFIDSDPTVAEPPELAWIRPFANAWVVRDLSDRIEGARTYTGSSLTHGPQGQEIVYTGVVGNDFGDREAWLATDGGNETELRSTLASDNPTRSQCVFVNGHVVSIAEAGGYVTSDALPFPLDQGGGGAKAVGGTADGEIALAAGPGGRVFAALPTALGDIEMSSSSVADVISGPGVWQDEQDPPALSNVQGLGLAVARDGTLAVSYRLADSDSLGLAVKPAGGSWTTTTLATFGPDPVTNLDFTDGLPSTDVAFLDGEAHVAIATSGLLNDGVRVYRENGDVVGSWSTKGDMVSVECEASGDWLHVAYRARATSEAPAQIGYAAVGRTEVPATPVVTIPDEFGPYDDSVDGFDLALDGNGFPKVVTVLDEPNNGSRLMVAQPADAIDPDGDGLPLLAEQAFALDPGAEDRESGVQREAFRVPGDPLRLKFSFPHPAIGDAAVSEPSVSVGEFVYESRLSSDLAGFGTTIPQGVSWAVTTETPLDARTETTDLEFVVSPTYQENEPGLFSSLFSRRQTPQQ